MIPLRAFLRPVARAVGRIPDAAKPRMLERHLCKVPEPCTNEMCAYREYNQRTSQANSEMAEIGGKERCARPRCFVFACVPQLRGHVEWGASGGEKWTSFFLKFLASYQFPRKPGGEIGNGPDRTGPVSVGKRLNDPIKLTCHLEIARLSPSVCNVAGGDASYT